MDNILNLILQSYHIFTALFIIILTYFFYKKEDYRNKYNKPIYRKLTPIEKEFFDAVDNQ